MDKNTITPMAGFLDDEARLPAIEWLAEQMPGGFFIYLADDSQKVIYINTAACRIFGCETVEEFKELTGNTFRGMVHPKDFPKTQASIDEQIAKDHENQLDYVVYRIIRKDGAIRWVDDYGHYTYLPGYGDVYYVFIGDITDTCRIEEARKRNRQLKKALEDAERANRAKTAFLSNMSHEIRTPITAILGMNEIIRRESTDENILNCSENIRRASNSLLRIISDLLDFAKIEAGKLTIIPVEYSTAGMIGDLYNMIQFRAEEKGLSIYLQIDPRLPSRLSGDQLRLKQIITNLLNNAIKYTEKGSITLRVGLVSAQSGTAAISVSVSDTGIGIKEEEMGYLFESFTRLDAKRTRTIEGAGLGLPICKELLQMMDSELSVESEYDVGSTFSFVVNQRIVDPEPIGEFHLGSAQAAEKEEKDALSFTAPKSRILLVDDTPMNLQVIEGLLKPTQMQIDTALSAAEGIEKFSIYPYDLVFLDYRMPQMDGIETLEKLREILPDKTEKTPIISLTASAVAGDKEKMLSAGFTDYLSKPINLPKMKELLIRYLPDDELIFLDENDEEIQDDSAELPKKLFTIDWLDVNEGIEYCGTAAMYRMALLAFASAINEKASLIEKCIKEKDYKLYTINVHSIKSTALTIGAAGLSEKARELELAGKAGDYAKIWEKTPSFLEEYRGLKEKLSRVIDLIPAS